MPQQALAPITDFVALLATADVAMALHHDELKDLLTRISLQAPESGTEYLAFAALGMATCVLLVYGIERDFERNTTSPLRGIWRILGPALHSSNRYLIRCGLLKVRMEP